MFKDSSVERDEFLAIIGILVGLALIATLFLSKGGHFIEFGIAVFLPCLIYLIMKRRMIGLQNIFHPQSSYEFSKRTLLVTNITFFILYLYSTFSVLFRPQLYSRPLEYFVSISVLVSIIAIEIFFASASRSYVILTLFKILLIATSLRLSLQLMYPGLIGFDPWWHQKFTSKVLESGSIPEGYAYSKLPIFHLITSSTVLITGLDYKLSAILSISLPNIGSLIFIFLIGKSIFNEKAGLLSALIAGIADWYIQAGFYPIPNTLGTMWILLIIFMIFELKYRFRLKYSLLILFTFGISIMTHTISCVAISLLLVLFWMSNIHYKKWCIEEEEKPLVKLVSVILFSFAMMGYWIYISGHITNIGLVIKNALMLDYLISPEAILQYRYGMYDEFLLSVTGILIFYGVSLIGMLSSFSKIRANKYSFALAYGGVAVTIVVFFGYAFTLTGFYPQRWFYYSQPIMAIFVAAGLLFIVSIFRNSLKATFSILMITLILSFFMITSPVSNPDAPIYSPNITVRLFYYESEMEAVDTIRSIYHEELFTDVHYRNYFGKYPFITHDFTENVIAANFEGLQAIVVRDWIIRNPFYTKGYLGIYEIDYNLVSGLDMYNRVYDSGTVFLYLHPQCET